MANKAPDRRPLSRFGAWALAFGCVIGWGCFVMPGTTFLPNAGPLGTAIALGIAAVVMILIAVNYRFMVQKHPVAGGSFVYAKEVFGHRHAFICGWALILSFFSLIAQNGSALALISRNLMGHFAEFGFSYNLAGFETYFGEILLAIGVFAVVAVLLARKVRIAYVLQSIFAICIVILLVAIIGSFVATSSPSVSEMAPAFNPGKQPVLGILAVLSFAPWAFLGFDVVSQVADELSFPVRRVGGIMIVAIVLGALVYIGNNAIAATGTPSGYASWSGYVASLDNYSGITSIPVFNAVSTLFGKHGILLLDVATLGAVLSGIVGFFVATVKLATAMADNGHLPAWFSVRSTKHGSPTHTIFIVFIAASVFVLFGRSVLSWIVDMSSIGAAVAFLYTSAAALKLARREKRTAIAATGVIGIVFSIVFILLLLAPIAQIGAALQIQSIVFLIAWITLGLNFYRPPHAKRKEMDLGERTAIDEPEAD